MSDVPLSTKTLETFTEIASLAWWIYIMIVILVFFGGLLLNYIVKKINEAHLETRFENLSNRAAASQATQILRPIAEPDKPVLPINGISLVFNKEDNLLEDKRRKDEPNKLPPIRDVEVNLTIASTENMEQRSIREDEFTESAFLGSIYKELFEDKPAVERSKSLSSAITHRDSIMSDIFNQIVWKKITESKSTPSIKKFSSMKSEEYFRERILDLVRYNVPDTSKNSHLAFPINQSYSEPADQSDKIPTTCSMELPHTSSGCK